MKRTKITIAVVALIIAGLLALKARASLTPLSSTSTLVAGAALANQSTVAGFYRSFHSGSSNAVVSNSAANFIPFDGVAAAQATNEGDVSTIVSAAATLKNLKCVLTSATGTVTVAGGTSYVIALDKNLSASAATCTILAAASSCTDTTDSVSVAIGDQVDYLVTPSGTPTALVVKCSMESDI
jgi:hypothetical protein